MLEEICKRRAVLGEVVFMYVPAHTGASPNEYADAAAKAGTRMEHVDTWFNRNSRTTAHFNGCCEVLPMCAGALFALS